MSASCDSPVSIQGKQRECLRETDFSATRGRTVTAESVYDCSKISEQPHRNFTNQHDCHGRYYYQQ